MRNGPAIHNEWAAERYGKSTLILKCVIYLCNAAAIHNESAAERYGKNTLIFK